MPKWYPFCLNGLVILACLTRGSTLAQTTRPADGSGLVAPDAFVWGINGHPLGGNGVYTEDRGISLKQQMELLKRLGIQWYRCDVFAREQEPGVWEHPDELDLIVPAAEAAGVRLYAIHNPPMELRPYEGLSERMSLAEVERLCYRVARRAAEKWKGRIPIWDLMNEPDGWTVKMPAANGDRLEHYDPRLIATAAAIMRGQAAGIRAGDPKARISLNTGGWVHTGFVDHMIREKVDFDVLSWHWYSEMGRLDRIEALDGFNLLAKLASYGKPIWLGEVNHRPAPPGADDAVEQKRADWLIETMRQARGWRAQGVEAFFVYELLDGHVVETGYGIVGVNRQSGSDGGVRFTLGEPKQVFHRIARLVREMR